MQPSAHLFYSTDAPPLRLAWHEPLPGTRIPEVVVQEIWREQRIVPRALCTTGGQPVQVIDPGTLNTNGGADFRNARLRIGETVWFGEVEIHTTSGGWFAHGHHTDPAYNRVVLHVALQPDLWTGSLVRADGTPVPELILAPHLDSHFRERLMHFFARPAPARPCDWGEARLSEQEVEPWLLARSADRLLRRARVFRQAPDLADHLYERIAAALGYGPNVEPMRRLSARVPLAELLVLRSPRDREALLLGMAGLLPEGNLDHPRHTPAEAQYVADLQRRFAALHPRGVPPLDRVEWHYSRLRPANFPELRIAQLAALVAPASFLCPDALARLGTMLLEGAPLAAFAALLDAAPDPFWTHHYRLTHPAAPHAAAMGADTQQRLLGNVLVPAALALTPPDAEADAVQAAQRLLHGLKGEDDQLTREFGFLKGRRRTFAHTQGIHELDEQYCALQRCMECAIGQRLLGNAAPPASRTLSPCPAAPLS